MYTPCKRDSNLEIRIEVSSCRPQYDNDKLYSSVVKLKHGVANQGHRNINNKKKQKIYIHLDVCELKKKKKKLIYTYYK